MPTSAACLWVQDMLQMSDAPRASDTGKANTLEQTDQTQAAMDHGCTDYNLQRLTR